MNASKQEFKKKSSKTVNYKLIKTVCLMGFP